MFCKLTKLFSEDQQEYLNGDVRDYAERTSKDPITHFSIGLNSDPLVMNPMNATILSSFKTHFVDFLILSLTYPFTLIDGDSCIGEELRSSLKLRNTHVIEWMKEEHAMIEMKKLTGQFVKEFLKGENLKEILEDVVKYRALLPISDVEYRQAYDFFGKIASNLDQIEPGKVVLFEKFPKKKNLNEFFEHIKKQNLTPLSIMMHKQKKGGYKEHSILVFKKDFRHSSHIKENCSLPKEVFIGSPESSSDLELITKFLFANSLKIDALIIIKNK